MLLRYDLSMKSQIKTIEVEVNYEPSGAIAYEEVQFGKTIFQYFPDAGSAGFVAVKLKNGENLYINEDGTVSISNEEGDGIKVNYNQIAEALSVVRADEI